MKTDQGMFFRVLAATLVPALLVLTGTSVQAGVIVDPVPGTGSIALISNGGFETGDLTHWPGRIIGTSNPGDFAVTTERAFSGSYSAKTVPARNFTGPGFSRVHDAIALTGGVEYIIGGYFYFDQLLLPAVYLDLNDVSGTQVAGGDINFERLFDVTTAEANDFLSNNQDRWIFAYESFTPLIDLNVTPRIVMDRNVQTSSLAYIDDVFLIEASSFSVPASSSAVPEPSAWMMIACGVIWAVRRRKKTP